MVSLKTPESPVEKKHMDFASMHSGLNAQFDDSVSKIPPYSLRSNNKALRIRYGVIANDSVFVTEQL